MALVAAELDLGPTGDDYSKPYREYLAAPEPFYGWEEKMKFTTLLGGTAHKLNVTSLQWLDESIYKVKDSPGDSSVWKHEVFVIEPATVKHRNATIFYIASLQHDCLDSDPITGNF